MDRSLFVFGLRFPFCTMDSPGSLSYRLNNFPGLRGVYTEEEEGLGCSGLCWGPCPKTTPSRSAFPAREKLGAELMPSLLFHCGGLSPPSLSATGGQFRESWLLQSGLPRDCERRHQHEPWLTQLPLGLIKGLLKAQAGIRVGKLKDVGVGALGSGGTQLQLGGWEGKRVAERLLF